MKKAAIFSSILSRCLQVLLLAFFLSFSACAPKKGLTNTAADTTATSKSAQFEKLNFEKAYFDGIKEKILGNYERAEVLLLQAMHIAPTSAATMYELAMIYTYQNRKNQALLYSKKAAILDEKNIWYQLLYAQNLKENKKNTELITLYQKLIRNYPNRTDFYFELANANLYANKLNDALKVYNNIEDRNGVSEEVSMQKIKIYKALKNYDEAVDEARKLIKSSPQEPKYYGILGELYQEKGQDEKAFDAYTELLKIDPKNAFVHLSLADYYRNKKQDKKAFEEIKIAFKNNELDIDTKIKILLSYYSITETYVDLRTEADTLCKILVETHPDEAKAFAMYGDFLYRDKKLEEARIQYRKSIALDNEKFALWNQLLIINSELNDFSSLEKESNQAIELFPNQALPYFFNGIANIQLKKYLPAVKILDEGRNFAFDKLLLAQFYASIGDAQNQLVNYPASDSAYTKSLELDPNNVYVLNNFAYYLSLRNTNLKSAETMSKKSNALDPNNSSYQDTYGWILYQMKKYDDAKVWIEKAIDNGGKNNGTLLEHYADILFQLGDKEKALQYWMDAKKAGGTSDLIDKKIVDKKLYE
ncbi:MAG: tetratricopeptide repeat protein [Bacteroidia bacterium]